MNKWLLLIGAVGLGAGAYILTNRKEDALISDQELADNLLFVDRVENVRWGTRTLGPRDFRTLSFSWNGTPFEFVENEIRDIIKDERGMLIGDVTIEEFSTQGPFYDRDTTYLMRIPGGQNWLINYEKRTLNPQATVIFNGN